MNGRRIINIGVRSKWFVLQYAGEVRNSCFCHINLRSSYIMTRAPFLQDACVRIDIRRMIEQPNTTQDIDTTVRDMVVFVLSVPFVGEPSRSMEQLQDWVMATWQGLCPSEKKTGRAPVSSTMFPSEVHHWWLPPWKILFMAQQQMAVQCFKVTQQAADGITWCDYLTGMLPTEPTGSLIDLLDGTCEKEEQQQMSAYGGTPQVGKRAPVPAF